INELRHARKRSATEHREHGDRCGERKYPPSRHGPRRGRFLDAVDAVKKLLADPCGRRDLGNRLCECRGRKARLEKQFGTTRVERGLCLEKHSLVVVQRAHGVCRRKLLKFFFSHRSVTPIAFRRRAIPSRMRVFTVPSGVLSVAAISLWL